MNLFSGYLVVTTAVDLLYNGPIVSQFIDIVFVCITCSDPWGL